MAKLNKKPEKIYTYEGAIAAHCNAEQQLRRSVMACMLWESTFYEDGESIADRIIKAVKNIKPEIVSQIAVEARAKMKLRHVPLLIADAIAELPGNKTFLKDLLAEIIQRPDELTEFLAIYWRNGRCPLSAQVKKGLARAFTKFDEYRLAKYNRDEKIKLRDVLFLCHAKPKDQEQADLWKRLIDNKLTVPDTWEVALSTGRDKKETWERLIRENKLGALALLRNLRNMYEVNVPIEIIACALEKADFSRVLPFRFIAAAKAAPQYEEHIDKAMLKALQQMPKLKGKTIIIIDVSGSMYGHPVSQKSEMDRALAACALGSLGRELCEQSAIYATAGNDYTHIHKTALVPSRHGMALVDAIYGMCKPLGGGGIFLNQVCNYVKDHEQTADRTIVITDEQDCSAGSIDAPSKAKPLGRGYLLNVNTYENGIAYKPHWIHIDGWSEAVFDYIMQRENTITNE